MKAITVCQPYAELIASGIKRIENRTWTTNYRGEVAIHAGKSRAWLAGANLRFENSDLKFGAVVAVVRLTHCVRVKDIPELAHRESELAWLAGHEHAQGPWCWVLTDVRRLEPAIECRGKQGLWEWEADPSRTDEKKRGGQDKTIRTIRTIRTFPSSLQFLVF